MSGVVIQSVSKSYTGSSSAAVLKDLNLDIEDGKFVTLLGPSGCGKTTTLRLIAGYITPDTGSVTVGGQLMSSPAGVVPPENRGMGMVFQNYAVWPHKTVFENIAFGLKLRRKSSSEIRATVARAIDLVGLKGLDQRYPNELSGGQQQRVALARSIVVEPGILLLDEPLSNLDAKLREKMRSELKELQRRTAITFVYVTHDQAEALALSDKIAVMHGGLLQQYGTPFEVYNTPANRIVADFMGLVNLLPAKVLRVNGMEAEVEASDGLRLIGTVAGEVIVGSNVEIAVRPENVRLSTAGAGAQAVVRDQVFLGNISEYLIGLPSGTSLRVQTHPLQQYANGTTVSIAIDENRCSIFPAG